MPDYSDHMSEGRKDMVSIGQVYKDKVAIFNPKSMCTDAFFLMVPVMSKKLVKLSVQHILGHFVSMVMRMCCLYFSVTWLISDQLKRVCKIFLCSL